MLILEHGQFVGELGGLRRGRRGDDESICTERAPALRERLDGAPKICSGEGVVVLALDDCVPAVRLSTGQVDAVLRLSWNAVASRLHAPQAQHPPRYGQYKLLKPVPADAEVKILSGRAHRRGAAHDGRG